MQGSIERGSKKSAQRNRRNPLGRTVVVEAHSFRQGCRTGLQDRPPGKSETGSFDHIGIQWGRVQGRGLSGSRLFNTGHVGQLQSESGVRGSQGQWSLKVGT